MLLANAACEDGAERSKPQPAGGVAGFTVASRRAIDEQRDAAARRATTWLFDNQERMESRWALAIFNDMAQLTLDPEVLAACDAILERRSKEPITSLPAMLSRDVIRSSGAFLETLAELDRRKFVGQPYQPWVDQLVKLLREDGARAWPEFQLTQRSVVIHRLSRLGITPPGTLDEVKAEIRSIWNRGDSDVLVESRPFMFAVTHVFLSASGYYTREIDPNDFEPETAILRYALEHYLTRGVPEDRFFIEIQAEVVSSLKLQRIPEDEFVYAMFERLLEFQHENGSFGVDVRNHLNHATSVVMASLMDLPPKMGDRSVEMQR